MAKVTQPATAAAQAAAAPSIDLEVTYQLVFVPEHGHDLVAHPLAVGPLPVVHAAAVAYHARQWVGERTPDLYGKVWSSGLPVLAAFAAGDLYAAAVRVEYGVLVIC